MLLKMRQTERTTASRLCCIWCICSVMLQLIEASALPQNPFESAVGAALALASSAAQVFENGAVLSKGHDFETGIMSAHSNSEVGMGNAIRRRSDSSEEDSDEDRKRRRKRAIELHDDQLAGNAVHSHAHLHRGKRSPCATNTPTDAADYDEVERKRRKAAQRRRAAAKKARSKTKKVSTLERRRRQADNELDDLDVENFDNVGSKLSEHTKRFAEKVRNIWESFATNMKDMVEQVQKSIAGAKA